MLEVVGDEPVALDGEDTRASRRRPAAAVSWLLSASVQTGAIGNSDGGGVVGASAR